MTVKKIEKQLQQDKRMQHSIRHRIMLIYVGLMVATILAILVVNNWWLERYYVNQKLKVMEEAYNTVNHKVMEEAQDKVILATVKGDIHDIGKNIVKVLLENYSFDVIDLGKDVPPEEIVETAIKEDVRLVGLSALMTTTVVSMEETIRQLREKKPECKVMVGGAVLNQDYSDMIGADFYGKDAMQSVYYAQQLFGGEK